jgi:hypothetical protein
MGVIGAETKLAATGAGVGELVTELGAGAAAATGRTGSGLSIWRKRPRNRPANLDFTESAMTIFRLV